jgi:stage II sporulation protein M
MREPSPGALPRLRHDLALVRRPIFAAAALFLLGFLYGLLQPESITPWMDRLEQMAGRLQEASPFRIFLVIFVNNTLTAALSILLGPLFGIFPAVSAAVNGALLGLVAVLYPADLWKLVFHGIFEIPAIFLAWGLGFWCGAGLWRADRVSQIKFRLATAFRLYWQLIVPLLFLAAVIEALAIVYLP